MEELKPCPFSEEKPKDKGSTVVCTSCGNWHSHKRKHWQERPIEQALQEKITKLEEDKRELMEALKFCHKKRNFEGTPKTVVYQMETALLAISAVAKAAINKVEGGE